MNLQILSLYIIKHKVTDFCVVMKNFDHTVFCFISKTILTKIYMYKCNVTYEIVYNIQDINITNNIINIIRCTQNGILSAFHSQDDVCRNITLDLNRQKYSFSIENNLPNAILLRKITHVLAKNPWNLVET